jgi:hypothetical protein
MPKQQDATELSHFGHFGHFSHFSHLVTYLNHELLILNPQAHHSAAELLVLLLETRHGLFHGFLSEKQIHRRP